MKLSHFLLAAGLCSFSAATAQTVPTQSAPSQSAPGPRGTTTASPSAVPSGTAPVDANPKGAVSAGEVFTTGSPTNGRSSADKRAMRQQHKAMKVKTKM